MGLLQAALLAAAVAYTGPTDNVVLDFSATWCGPCQRMSPLVSRLEREGLPIRKVDVDQDRALAARFGITSMPTFLLVVDGKVVERVVGPTSEAQLRQMVARIPTKAPEAKPQVPSSSGPKPSLRKDPPIGANDHGHAITAPRARPRTDELVARGNIGDERRPDGEFLSVAARIHVQDSKGVNVGTGTIIDSRPGRTVILTCGHIFRNMDQGSQIEVELFANGQPRKVAGKYLKHDNEADVGLLSVATKDAWPVARVAPPQFAVAAGDAVVSVGCGGGADPTVQRIKVTALNRYLGPANFECTGVPQQGRSGGGLFTTDGLVIGVCTAADPRDKKGLYCALKPIQDLLDACQMTALYTPGKKRPAVQPEPQETAEELIAADAALETAAADESDEVRAAVEQVRKLREKTPSEARQALSETGDAEIVCVIRPIGKPQAASKVVVIHRATPEFVDQLTGQLENQPEFNRTALRQPRPAPSTAKPALTARANAPKSLAVDEGTPRPFRRK